jgi:hypothetical protein
MQLQQLLNILIPNQTLMLKELRQDKTFRVYCWQALSALVVV